MRRALVILLLVAASGCSSRESQTLRFELEKPAIAFGEAPRVTYNVPVPKVEGQQYWITLVPAGAADSEWGTYAYLVPGDTRQSLSVPHHGGDWEVRLHDLYPQNTYKVLQRVPLRVEGGPAAMEASASSPGTAEATAETGSAPASDGAATSELGRRVDFTVEANATTTKFGPVRVETRPLLHMRRAARDGGEFYDQSAAPGRQFLVVHFPETERRQEQIVYEDEETRLYLEGSLELKSYAAAPGGINSEVGRQRGDPLRFETEIWMATINEANAYPFAVAFEVPAGAKRAWLKVEDKIVALAIP